jgi:GDP-L-fucose synthase
VKKSESIFVAGHKGMVGSATLKELKRRGYNSVITASKEELDLRDYSEVKSFFDRFNIKNVILCAAKVGGILANNNYRADFISDNLSIGSNIVKACHEYSVSKLINLGSSCIYPKEAEIPIKEESLLTGLLEYTNEPYAIAKIATLKMCQSFYDQHGSNFYSLMPCNLYGINDNFDLNSSHVLPALIRKVHEAKQNNLDNVILWGSGKPLREFLFSEDVASAIVFCLENVNAEDVYSQGISHLNCGSDEELSIKELMLKIKKIIEYEGDIILDPSKPDGTFRKKMDNSRIKKLGFIPQVSMDEGIAKTYSWYLENM